MAESTHPARHIDEDTLTIEQASKVMHLGVEAMRELIEAGEVPACRLNKKHTVLLRADLIDYIRRKGREQAEKRKRPTPQRRPTHTPASSKPPPLERYELANQGLKASPP